MAWTNIPNANLAAGAPIRSVDTIALRDNITAVADGDSGAPRIKDAAMTDGLTANTVYYPIFSNEAANNVTATTSLIKMLSFRCLRGGVFNIRFRIQDQTGSPRTIGSRVYVNGVAVGSLITGSVGAFAARTDTHTNITITRGQILDIYGSSSFGNQGTFIISSVQIGSTVAINPFTDANRADYVTSLPI